MNFQMLKKIENDAEEILVNVDKVAYIKKTKNKVLIMFSGNFGISVDNEQVYDSLKESILRWQGRVI